MKELKENGLRNLLINKLFDIWHSENFVLGVMNIFENHEEVRRILDFVEKGNCSLPSDITVQALYIAREREGTLDQPEPFPQTGTIALCYCTGTNCCF